MKKKPTAAAKAKPTPKVTKAPPVPFVVKKQEKTPKADPKFDPTDPRDAALHNQHGEKYSKQ